MEILFTCTLVGFLVWAFLDKFKHFFGVHEYYDIKTIQKDTQLMGCKHCDKLFKVNMKLGTYSEYHKES